MSGTKIVIDIAKAFSSTPAGRYRSDGDFSGEVFRESFLVPALLAGNNVVVNLDGTEGYGSSFLEEAFGGLVREHGVSAEAFRDQVELKSDEDPSLVQEILGYVDDEAKRRPRPRA